MVNNFFIKNLTRAKNMKLAYTIKETAEQLGCGLNTTYNMVKDKKIRSFKFGRKIMIPANAVKEFIEEQCQ